MPSKSGSACEEEKCDDVRVDGKLKFYAADKEFGFIIPGDGDE